MAGRRHSSGAGLGSATCNIPQLLVTLQPCRYLYMNSLSSLLLSPLFHLFVLPLLCFFIFFKLNKCLINI